MATSDVSNDDQVDLEAVYQQVLVCEPAIPPDEVEPLADLVMKKERVGRPWRLTAVVAGEDGEFFKRIATSVETAKAFAPTVNVLRDFAGLLRTMADLAECSAARIATAGCNHEKFLDWMEDDDHHEAAQGDAA